jgi:hypothetical protein
MRLVSLPLVGGSGPNSNPHFRGPTPGESITSVQRNDIQIFPQQSTIKIANLFGNIFVPYTSVSKTLSSTILDLQTFLEQIITF